MRDWAIWAGKSRLLLSGNNVLKWLKDTVQFIVSFSIKFIPCLQVREHLASHMLDILDPSKFEAFRGDLLPERLRRIGEERAAREEERRQKREEYERMMEAQRKKVRWSPHEGAFHKGPCAYDIQRGRMGVSKNQTTVSEVAWI